jgi:hypothetical protein
MSVAYQPYLTHRLISGRFLRGLPFTISGEMLATLSDLGQL